MIHNDLLVVSLAQASRNRCMVADRLNTMGYVEQELLREHWVTGEPKPDRLQVAEYGDWPAVSPKHYHPYANYRATDGKGRKSVMRSWLGQLGIGLDHGIAEQNERIAGEIEFEPAL